MAGSLAWYHAVIRGRQRGLQAGLARVGLALASLPYGLAVRGRNVLFDGGWKKSERVSVPVVSVGNLTAGGTGKTPCVEYIARFYRQQERLVAILSRGYGGEAGRNDEALVLEENLPDVPHLQGADRVELARVAIEELESEVLVLDDGFQHRQLARDLDVVLIDATDPWGQGWLLPRGLLREPRSGLKRASVIMLTRCDQTTPEGLARLQQEVQRLAPGRPIVETIHAPTGLVCGERIDSPADWRGRTTAAFCGIGNPEAFRRTLTEGLGISVSDFRVFPDHHAYRREDVDDLQRWAQKQPADAAVLTTQKDMVKLRLTELGERPFFALRIGLCDHDDRGMEPLDRQLKAVLRDE